MGGAEFASEGIPEEFRFQCRTRLFPFAPTTALRSPSPARAGEALLRAVFSQNHAISASPAGAGERSTSANHTSFYSCSWDVFPYDLFPVQLCPIGQVSKWRAQRADRGAHAARGFVCGAATLCDISTHTSIVSMPHAALWVVQHVMIKLGTVALSGFNAARGFVGGAAAPSLRRGTDFAGFNAARGFVGGAAPVKRGGAPHFMEFQCRTRLCGWCNPHGTRRSGCRRVVSMPHAALWVVQLARFSGTQSRRSFNAARGFVGGATASLAALVPLGGKSPFGKSPKI